MNFLIGLGAGLFLAAIWFNTRRRSAAPSTAEIYPALEHIADLLRRAHNADIVSLVRVNREPMVLGSRENVPDTVLERAQSAAKLALADGREHVFPGAHTIVARGNGETGIALVLPTRDVPAPAALRLSGDLRRILDHVPAEPRVSGPNRIDLVRGRDAAAGVDTLAGVAFGLCARAHAIAGRPTAVVLRDETSETASVIAVSRDADRHLVGITVSPDSAIGRACLGDTPVVAETAEELFGRMPADRRGGRFEATVYPLHDGRMGVGALLIFGKHEGLDDRTWEQIMWLAVDAGPPFAAAAAVKRAEDRAKTDVLTSLPNRMALQEAMAAHVHGACSIVCVDIDHFKRLNDTLGHAAGDAALKHVARLFRQALRRADLPARIGGEEFALWLPGVDQARAVEVAERVRRRVAETRWEWAGQVVEITCSLGVASCPETATQVANLLPTADAALYRAKRAGRNRVEAAVGTAVSR